MCSEVALWSLMWKKWDLLVWRSGTIRHFSHASRSLSDVTSVCCGEGHRRVWKSGLIRLKLWFRLTCDESYWGKGHGRVGGGRRMILEEWKQQPQKGGKPIVSLVTALLSLCSCLWKNINFQHHICKPGLKGKWTSGLNLVFMSFSKL